MERPLSFAHGISLADETGCGPLTRGGYLQEVTRRHGPAEAAVIHLADRSERWTYNDLWHHSRQVARALRSSGVGKGTRVGILMTNRLEFLSCLFGTALAGGVATAISTFFTAPELDEVLRASGCSVLLMERRVLKKDFVEILAELEPQVVSSKPGKLASTRFPFLRHVASVDDETDHGAVQGWQAFLARGDVVPPAVIEGAAAAVTPADPGVLFFSSGSTGKAKGILTAHRSVCLQLWRWKQWYGLTDPPRTWSANGFFFSGNFSMTLGAALSSGGCIVLQRWFDPSEAIALITREKVTQPLAWPHQWPQLESAPGYPDADFSALREVDGNFPLARHPTVYANWQEPRHAYGSTETFTLITVFPAGTPDTVTLGSHGLPTAGSTVKIVNPITGDAVPLGERGEVAVKGPALMLGYIGIPIDETLDDKGFFRTGDGGYLDGEGRLFWEGRLSDIIKTGGANVSPIEIDEVLARCPGVTIVRTVGVPDPLLGELVVACIVPLEHGVLSEEAVRDFAKSHLASFKVPRRVLFFYEADMALTGSAKIRTADLREIAALRLHGMSDSAQAPKSTAGSG